MIAIERFQAETFAKPTTDGALAAHRHLGKPVILYLISHVAASRRRSILGFRLPYDWFANNELSAHTQAQPETQFGAAKTIPEFLP